MASSMRFYDAEANSGGGYDGHWSAVIDALSVPIDPGTIALEIDFAVIVPDGLGTNLAVGWIYVDDVSRFSHITGGFSIDSNSPLGWMVGFDSFGVYGDDTSDTDWTLGGGGVFVNVWQYDGSWSVTPDTFAPSIYPASAPNWWLTPAPQPFLDFANTLSYSDTYGTVFIPTLGGPEGTVVKLGGFNLTRVTSVKFGDVAATFTVISNTEIHAVVPHATDASFVVTVRDSGGSASTTYEVLFWKNWERLPQVDIHDDAFPFGRLRNSFGVVQYRNDNVTAGSGPPPYTPQTRTNGYGVLPDYMNFLYTHENAHHGDTGFSQWQREITLGIVDLSHWLSPSSPGPTHDETSAPDYVTFQLAHNGFADVVSPIMVDYVFMVLPPTDDEPDHDKPDPLVPSDSMLGVVQLRRPPTSARAGPFLLTPDLSAWPTPASLTSWELLDETPLYDGETLSTIPLTPFPGGYELSPAVSGIGVIDGWNFDGTTAPFFPATLNLSRSVGGTLTFGDVSEFDFTTQLPLVLMMGRFADGTLIAEPDLFGNIEGDKETHARLTAQLRMTYEPVAYRILAKTPIAPPPPLTGAVDGVGVRFDSR